MKRILMLFAAPVLALSVLGGTALSAQAAPPVVQSSNGAYVRLVGNPAKGTAMFQFGWSASTVSSDAVGYWVGIYNVTESHYEWVDTEAFTGPMPALAVDAHPTKLTPDEYKIVFFVRGGLDPAWNLAEIDGVHFTVTK